MASSLLDSSGTVVKCRKCRHQLLEEPPHRILESSSDQDNQEASNTINICDDNLPQWIADAIEEVRVLSLRNHKLALFGLGKLDQGQAALPRLLSEAGRV